MKKAGSIKQKKWLKDRRRANRIKRNHNHETKTKQRVSIETIAAEEEMKKEGEKKEKVVK